MGFLVTLLKWCVFIVVVLVVLSMFMSNAAAWGSNVGQFFTAIQDFLTNAIGSSPIS